VVERAGVTYDRLRVSDVLDSFLAPDRAAWLATRRRVLFIALPPGYPRRDAGAVRHGAK